RPWALAGAPMTDNRLHHELAASRLSGLQCRAGQNRAGRSSARSLSSAPILLFFSLYCRASWVLHLEPIGRSAAAVGRTLTLRHYAFEPKVAGVAEYDLAVFLLDVLVEAQAGRCLGQDGRQRGLADLERIAAQVVAVELDQVEGIQEHAGVIPPI